MIFKKICRTHLALSDISCVFWSFLSDISSCGHIWLCRTYLAGTRPAWPVYSNGLPFIESNKYVQIMHKQAIYDILLADMHT